MLPNCFNIVFAGTPLFAQVQLSALLKEGHTLSAVLTQPDKPQGRSKQPIPSAVKQCALEHNILVLQPKSLKKEAIQTQLATLKPDLLIVAAYGLLLPKAVLDIPKYGCLNVHASLLPSWRGASPIQQSILAGDPCTGITIMKMSEGLDEGDILSQASIPLTGTETTGTLHDQLATTGAVLLLKTLADLPTHLQQAHPQDSTLASYASKIQKSDAGINWHQPATVIERQIRGFQPWPVSFSWLDNKMIRFFKASALPDLCSATPGTIVQSQNDTLIVATGQGLLQIHQLQLPSKTILPTQAVLNGYATLFKINQQFRSS